MSYLRAAKTVDPRGAVTHSRLTAHQSEVRSHDRASSRDLRTNSGALTVGYADILHPAQRTPRLQLVQPEFPVPGWTQR
jgi:hypothetical protein